MKCLVQSHRNLVFLTTSEEGTLPYCGRCNILLTAEIAQDVGKWLLGGFSHKAKKQCKCGWNIEVCTLHLVSANDKTVCEWQYTMHSLLRHLVAVGRVRTEEDVCHCTEKITTSVSAKDSREKTAKMVIKTSTTSASFINGSLPTIAAWKNIWFLAKYSCVTEWWLLSRQSLAQIDTKTFSDN